MLSKNQLYDKFTGIETNSKSTITCITNPIKRRRTTKIYHKMSYYALYHLLSNKFTNIEKVDFSFFIVVAV